MMLPAQISVDPKTPSRGPSVRMGGRSVQRKCACGGSGGGASEGQACGDNKQKELQLYSSDREGLAGLARNVTAAGAVPPQDSPGESGIGAGHNFGRVRIRERAASRVQKRSEVSELGDGYEQEADSIARRVTGLSRSADSPASPQVQSLGAVAPIVQRASLGHTASSNADAGDVVAGAKATPDRGPAPPGLIVEDDAVQSGPGQMRKTEFLNQLERGVCAAADQELARVGRTAQGCPYIARWIGYYRTRSSQHIERALFRYAPEAASVRSAGDYIPIVAERIRRAVTMWATTGQITGVPEELAGQVGAGGLLASAGAVLSGIGGAVAGAIGSIGSAIGGLFRKARDGGPTAEAEPEQVHAQLGSGHQLDPAVKSRMEHAIGHDFSRVRVHTDSRAAELSNELNARAFTVGSDIAFAAGEYRPGTLIGDALLAHELAHVVQQAGGITSAAPMQKADNQHDSLEEDADLTAVSAVTSIWGGARGVLKGLTQKTPHLRSGLGLQRCHASAPSARPVTPGGSQTAPTSPAQGAPTSATQPASCVPTRTLTWSDFKGAVPAGSTLSAETDSGFNTPAWKPKLDITDTKEECTLGKKKSTKHTAKLWVDPADFDAIQPTMDQAKSWVLPKYKDPDKYCPTVTARCETEIDKQATEASKTCKQAVKPCQQFFDAGNQNYTIPVDGTPITVTSRAGCETTLVSSCEKVLAKNQLFELKEKCEGAVVVRATSKADCSSKKSSEACLEYYKKWSALLLKHEQGHFNISTIMADKARADLKAKAGTYTATVTECGKTQANNGAWKKFNALNAKAEIGKRGQDWIDLKDKAEKEYDDQTEHGCKQPEQATWDKKIASCLPDYDLNKPAVP